MTWQKFISSQTSGVGDKEPQTGADISDPQDQVGKDQRSYNESLSPQFCPNE